VKNKDEQARIIALEDSTPDSELSPERLAAKQDRLRKRQFRAREAEAKKAKQAAATYESIEQFWQANRSTLTSEERQALEAREDYVLELEEAMRCYIDGTDGTTEQERSDFIGEVLADAREHGLCNFSVLSIPRLWGEQAVEFRKSLEANERNRATATLVNLGYVTAIPERTFEDFRQKFLTPRMNPTIDGGKMAICSLCHSLDTSRVVLESESKYVCYRCLDAEHRSCATAKESLYNSRGQMKPKFWRGVTI
jgi:hypothetical protein